ncbi:MAG: penicillin acylase family protein [Mariniphaga sp.]|nr:penicillin acylase family protein [Mariniphaga sp.]
MKLIKRILSVVLILVIGGFLFLNNLKKAAIPDYNENVQLEGMKSEVTVLRDQYGIPHVYAENEIDLYKAVGFVMAQDRLWQFDLL